VWSYLERWWLELGNPDAAPAYRAVWALSTLPREATEYLKGQVRAVRKEKPERLRELVTSLDDDKFSVREAVTRELARLGPQAEGTLRTALRETTSAEARNRINSLLKTLETWAILDPETLRTVRAIWVLERIGNKEARSTLEDLAKGESSARPTQEAKAALARLTTPPRAAR
jgi:hypothetical protein